MIALEGPFAVLAVVLVVSGATKLGDPAPTTAMLAAVRLPASPFAARLVGIFELMVGIATFVVGGRVTAVVMAATYAGFALIGLRLLRLEDANVSCGCFGRASTRMSVVHVVANAVAALFALACAAVDVPGFVDARPDLPWLGIPQLGFILMGAALFIAVLTVLPDALDAARRVPRSASVREFGITET